MNTRSMIHTILFACYLIIFCLFCSTSFAHTLNRATILSNSCAPCHGTDGNSVGAIPSIAGKPAADLEQAMKAFRDGSRPSTIMMRHAKGYSDTDIKLLADYFSKR